MKKIIYFSIFALCALFTSCEYKEVEAPALAVVYNPTNADLVFYCQGDSLVLPSTQEIPFGTIFFSEDGMEVVGFEDARLPNGMIDAIKINKKRFPLEGDDCKLFWQRERYQYSYDAVSTYATTHTRYTSPVYYWTVDVAFLHRIDL